MSSVEQTRLEEELHFQQRMELSQQRSALLQTYLRELLTSGVSVSIANVATNPIDVVKVRLQLQTLRQANGLPSPGMLRTGINIVQQEGFLTLYNGLTAAVARGLLYGGFRLGLYNPIKDMLSEAGERPSLARKVLAGCLAGVVATALTNPLDLIKTRLQSQSGQYAGPVSVVRRVVAADGIAALWKGTLPSSTRAALLTASQCATYDEVKRAWMQATGWEDGLPTHLSASMVTGLVTTTVTAPVDVVKTNMFVGTKYSSPWHCAADIVRREGPQGLLKGWTANYARLGPQTTIAFIVMEKLRAYAGLRSL